MYYCVHVGGGGGGLDPSPYYGYAAIVVVEVSGLGGVKRQAACNCDCLPYQALLFFFFFSGMRVCAHD